MDKTIDWKVNTIIREVSGLEIREKELANNNDLHSMYLTDWIANKLRLASVWGEITADQRNRIIQAYSEIEDIARRLTLRWPEELSRGE